ncbi:hypothetical protein PPERSA_04848 [Pseudocohnilembus persalinus]|uniref:Uncharacterized protein n=1 Tax=Pseudocohnilembus persalinus TaxID=266149 RepID=A0A0V0QJ10_PSEPJ|nr:hypothetical protein PPERSA_04848 [Pseudocohnilembus persalinus]|eukprot:KRX02226.1 hypothetical protein PPERSA_04848 [Pseudocohnilembus persalinus]
MFAVTIEQNSNVYTKQPYYLIEVEQRNYERDEEGNLIKNKIPYVLEPCTTEHWEKIYNTETNDKLFGLEIESFLCPPLDFKPLSLQGVYQSDFFDFIKFNIVDCEEPEQKTEYFQNWDYTCLSDTEIAEYIEKDE